MKRFLLLLALLLIPATVLAESNTSVRWRTIDVPWVNTNSNGNPNQGYHVTPDSLTASINGIGQTAGTVDTTAWIDLNNIAWGFGNYTGTANMVQFRLNITGAQVNTDTLFVIADIQMDGGTTYSWATTSNMLTSGATVYDGMLSLYMAASITVPAQSQIPVGARKVRFRIRADGNNAASFLGARLTFTAPFDEEGVNGNRINWITKQVNWYNSANNAYGRIVPDSTTASINGVGLTSATVDTTAWINLSDLCISGNANVNIATAYSLIKILMDGTQNSTDTLFAFADWALDPSINSVVQTTATNILTSGATVYDGVLSNCINYDFDAQISLTAVPVCGARWVRFRVRADGNNAANFLNARFYICYPAYIE